MSQKHKFVLALLFVLTSHFASAGERVAFPDYLTGRWIVTKVLINRDQMRRLHYNYDDPVLRWRFFEISKNNLSGNLPEHFMCKSPVLEKTLMTAGGLMKDDMQDGSHFSSYQIPINDDKVLEIFRFICDGEYYESGISSDAQFDGAWLFRLDENKLAMRWFDNTILILEKQKSPINPSFSCDNSTNPTEKTICSSDELSSYDKSISDAYKLVLYHNRETIDDPMIKEFRLSQKQWIVKRNRCKSDVSCIKTSLIKRLNEIMDYDSNPE